MVVVEKKGKENKRNIKGRRDQIKKQLNVSGIRYRTELECWSRKWPSGKVKK